MERIYQDLDDHAELLGERGYLNGDVKPSKQVPYWLGQFEEELDQAIRMSAMDYGPVKFVMPMTGQFNENLQAVRFEFRYEYDPTSEKLSLYALHATLGPYRKTYAFKSDDELPAAHEVYQTLNAPIAHKDNIGLFINLYHEQRRDRDPGNDHREETFRDEFLDKHRDKPNRAVFRKLTR